MTLTSGIDSVFPGTHKVATDRALRQTRGLEQIPLARPARGMGTNPSKSGLYETSLTEIETP